jgi:hypothetical protein
MLMEPLAGRRLRWASVVERYERGPLPFLRDKGIKQVAVLGFCWGESCLYPPVGVRLSV